MVFDSYRVSDLIIDRLNYLGVNTAFVVTGGAAMHLNDSIGKNKSIHVTYCHHEQACAMAAESYARISKKPAIVNITAGPGGINALNGVFGAYTDSFPLIVLSGQAKRETSLRSNPVLGLRQLGDQEAHTVDIVSTMVKKACYLDTVDPVDVVDILDNAYISAVMGRPGPVWLDIPIDIQGASCDKELVSKLISKTLPLPESDKVCNQSVIGEIFLSIISAKRPVFLAGTGVSISSTENELINLAELFNVPVVTAWQHDVFPNSHRLFGGRSGTIGTRAGNFVVQNSDLVVVLGSRLNIRQISYNYKSFARNAKKIWIDIDEAELNKPFIEADIKLKADLREVLPQLISIGQGKELKKNSEWVDWCMSINKKYTPKKEDYPKSDHAINSYHFIDELFLNLKEKDIIVCANATATIVPHQIGKLKDGMRLISNSGSASMGYDLPAAIGAAIAAPEETVVCLAGDGSIMMNLQELATIAHHGMRILIFVLCNDGYLSIKQTQRNFFGRENGASSKSGLSYPDFKLIGDAFGIKSGKLNKECWKGQLKDLINQRGPIICEVPLDLIQEFEPRLKSRVENGKITTPELDDMFPLLEKSVLNNVRESAKSI